MRISDWSSDVCSSDLSDHHAIDAAFLASQEARRLHKLAAEQAETYASTARLVKATGAAAVEVETAEEDAEGEAPAARSAKANPVTRTSDRKSVVSAERAAVRVDHGGGRIINKNNNNNRETYSTKTCT